MRFFIDENLPPQLVAPLTAMFRMHEFTSSYSEALGGLKDLPLFTVLSERGYGAIITKDRGQIERNEEERRALFDVRLHWIGVKEPQAQGLHKIASWSAGITGALPHILELMPSTQGPMWFRVKGVEVQQRQRIGGHGPLWRTSWAREDPSPGMPQARVWGHPVSSR